MSKFTPTAKAWMLFCPVLLDYSGSWDEYEGGRVFYRARWDVLKPVLWLAHKVRRWINVRRGTADPYDEDQFLGLWGERAL
ncbi:hypothetical protein ATCM_12555 [Stenotrophomonas sp. ATCM1_4]|uniref:hypothetical protein n=1 Tax=Stenotrophomonas sp. ATCM1_4 TaxID=2259330 RepID=UPI00105139BA|nr:hypothetical protein [Stenotrophomonas sp. ATCM1_4]TDB28419.1 hypothetical protein ATCM_12555 [Stenotrophomonas sp. ATCM1_4]